MVTIRLPPPAHVLILRTCSIKNDSSLRLRSYIGILNRRAESPRFSPRFQKALLKCQNAHQPVQVPFILMAPKNAVQFCRDCCPKEVPFKTPVCEQSLMPHSHLSFLKLKNTRTNKNRSFLIAFVHIWSVLLLVAKRLLLKKVHKLLFRQKQNVFCPHTLQWKCLKSTTWAFKRFVMRFLLKQQLSAPFSCSIPHASKNAWQKLQKLSILLQKTFEKKKNTWKNGTLGCKCGLKETSLDSKIASEIIDFLLKMQDLGLSTSSLLP